MVPSGVRRFISRLNCIKAYACQEANVTTLPACYSASHVGASAISVSAPLNAIPVLPHTDPGLRLVWLRDKLDKRASPAPDTQPPILLTGYGSGRTEDKSDYHFSNLPSGYLTRPDSLMLVDGYLHARALLVRRNDVPYVRLVHHILRETFPPLPCYTPLEFGFQDGTTADHTLIVPSLPHQLASQLEKAPPAND